MEYLLKNGSVELGYMNNSNDTADIYILNGKGRKLLTCRKFDLKLVKSLLKGENNEG